MEADGKTKENNVKSVRLFRNYDMANGHRKAAEGSRQKEKLNWRKLDLSCLKESDEFTSTRAELHHNGLIIYAFDGHCLAKLQE